MARYLEILDVDRERGLEDMSLTDLVVTTSVEARAI
jgi:hypothetical protein